MAVTDNPISTRFDIRTLKTIGLEKPSRWPLTTTGCAHWMREPGTDNSINIQGKIGIMGPHLEVGGLIHLNIFNVRDFSFFFQRDLYQRRTTF